MANPSDDAQLGILPIAARAERVTPRHLLARSRRRSVNRVFEKPDNLAKFCKFLGLKREIRRRFPYRSYGKASISTGLLALFGGRWLFR
jgi:hypothetical protein